MQNYHFFLLLIERQLGKEPPSRRGFKKDKGVGAPTSAAGLNERRQGHCVAENVLENAREIPKTRCKDSHVYMIKHYKDNPTHFTAMATTVQMQNKTLLLSKKRFKRQCSWLCSCHWTIFVNENRRNGGQDQNDILIKRVCAKVL